MGAKRDAYVTVDRSSNARTVPRICVTGCDIARLGQVVLQGGQGIVSESWIKDIPNNGFYASFAAGVNMIEFLTLSCIVLIGLRNEAARFWWPLGVTGNF